MVHGLETIVRLNDGAVRKGAEPKGLSVLVNEATIGNRPTPGRRNFIPTGSAKPTYLSEAQIAQMRAAAEKAKEGIPSETIRS